MSDSIFPRELSRVEKDYIFSALPEWKSGYKKYRKKIEELSVIGSGRFGSRNLFLGIEGTKPDLDSPSSPIFADGTIVCEEGEIDILIHEEISNEIEIDIAAPFEEKDLEEYMEIVRWNYSEWLPGNKAPYDNSDVREVIIKPGEYIFAVADNHKKLWLYEYETGVNYIIPITNFYNHLMLSKNIRESKKVTKPGNFFNEHLNYSDEDLRSAFIFYNQYFKKVNLDIQTVSNKKEDKRFWNIFKKGK